MGPFLRSSSYDAGSVACGFRSSPVLVVPLVVCRCRFCRVVSLSVPVPVPIPVVDLWWLSSSSSVFVPWSPSSSLSVSLSSVPLLSVSVSSCPVVVFVVVAPLLFRHCVLPVFAVPVVSTPRTAARGDGVLVAIGIFASPFLVPAPFPLSSDVTPFCCCPDPSSTPQAGACSDGVVVGVPSWRCLVVNNIDKN